jgi:hypothetical protein
VKLMYTRAYIDNEQNVSTQNALSKQRRRTRDNQPRLPDDAPAAAVSDEIGVDSFALFSVQLFQRVTPVSGFCVTVSRVERSGRTITKQTK